MCSQKRSHINRILPVDIAGAPASRKAAGHSRSWRMMSADGTEEYDGEPPEPGKPVKTYLRFNEEDSAVADDKSLWIYLM